MQAALEQLGLDLVLVADPLETEQAQVLSLRPNNLVMVMDAEVEAVLERFDDLLALDDCRILFEESELIATRAGWDMARWSRHLSAKLLGHGDVLPAGHEMDTVTIKPAVSQQDDAKAIAEDRGAVVEAEPAPAAWLEIEPAIETVTGEQVPADLPPVLQPIADSAPQAAVEHAEAAETPAVMAATSASAVSDYADYDDLDAFSFLDQEAIAAAQARDAEAAAIREAEAEAETALRSEVLAEASLEPQEQSPADADVPSVAAANATWLDDYDAIDSLSFLDENTVSQAATDQAEPESIQDMVDTPSADAAVLFETVDLGDWQMPAELQAISPQTDTRLAQDAAVESVEPVVIDTAVAPESTQVLPDWSVYQDFEAISELPNAAHADSIDTGYREALAPVEPSDLAPEEAYQRVEEDLRQFDAPAAQDEWQDFEPPTLAPDIAQGDLAATAPQTDAPDTAKSVEGRVQQLFETVSQWSLSDISLSIDEGSKRPAFERNKDGLSQPDPQEPELRFSSPSIAAMSGAKDADPEPADFGQQEGAVLLLGGIGGPDPLRQILQALPRLFPVPVLVQQWLEGGHYDRLQRQMERVCQMPVLLAQPGMMAEHSKVYIVPCGVRVLADSSSQLRFVSAEGREEFANLLDALPSISSVAVLLSGASDAFVEPLLRFQQGGGKLLAQSEEGCYDHTMPALMASRGAQLDTPAGIAARIKALWSTTELK
ncbi:hypothetical protein CO613_00605 [Lysobacteraceae bacterium NML07-0707]|nr:hypothetical protein CO613_00605 [Xanthomonadaceae bacterium NML07-0707]